MKITVDNYRTLGQQMLGCPNTQPEDFARVAGFHLGYQGKRAEDEQGVYQWQTSDDLFCGIGFAMTDEQIGQIPSVSICNVTSNHPSRQMIAPQLVDLCLKLQHYHDTWTKWDEDIEASGGLYLSQISYSRYWASFHAGYLEGKKYRT